MYQFQEELEKLRANVKNLKEGGGEENEDEVGETRWKQYLSIKANEFKVTVCLIVGLNLFDSFLIV